MLVRSPIRRKFVSGRMVNVSSPLNRPRCVAAGGRARGVTPAMISTIAAMCSGVVPQQPPTMLMRPLSANSRSSAAVVGASSS
jgi:hypothetical protein